MTITISSIPGISPTSTSAGVSSISKSGSGKSFSDFMKETISEKIDVLHNFENASKASTTSQISELELIKAVNEADIQLHAFKTVWEKFLQKYETIIEKTNI